MPFAVDDKWTMNANTIFQFAKEQNQQGNVFPMFGSCLGLQLMTYLSVGFNNSVITDTPNDEGVTHPIYLTNEKSEYY